MSGRYDVMTVAPVKGVMTLDTHGRPATLDEFMEPIIRTLTNDQKERLKEIMKMEAEGMLAWGVKSGYFLWVREHPGEVPTKEQIRMWYLKLQP